MLMLVTVFNQSYLYPRSSYSVSLFSPPVCSPRQSTVNPILLPLRRRSGRRLAPSVAVRVVSTAGSRVERLSRPFFASLLFMTQDGTPQSTPCGPRIQVPPSRCVGIFRLTPRLSCPGSRIMLPLWALYCQVLTHSSTDRLISRRLLRAVFKSFVTRSRSPRPVRIMPIFLETMGKISSITSVVLSIISRSFQTFFFEMTKKGSRSIALVVLSNCFCSLASKNPRRQLSKPLDRRNLISRTLPSCSGTPHSFPPYRASFRVPAPPN